MRGTFVISFDGEYRTVELTDWPKRGPAHNVRFHRAAFKKVHHPVVGELEMNFEAMELASSPGLTMLVYSAPQGSPTADSLKVLASWAATAEQTGELASHGTATP